MDEISPYAVAYKYMHEVEQEEQMSACAENRIPRDAFEKLKSWSQHTSHHPYVVVI